MGSCKAVLIMWIQIAKIGQRMYGFLWRFSWEYGWHFTSVILFIFRHRVNLFPLRRLKLLSTQLTRFYVYDIFQNIYIIVGTINEKTLVLPLSKEHSWLPPPWDVELQKLTLKSNLHTVQSDKYYSAG